MKTIKPDYSPWKRPRNFFSNLKETCRWVVDFFERGLRGWSRRDVWSLDYYLLRVYIGSLRELRDKGRGYPYDGDEIKCREDWEKLLTTMIEGFEAGLSWLEGFRSLEDSRKLKFGEAQELLQKYFFALWD